MNYKQGLAIELEKYLIPLEKWSESTINNFPEDIQKELRYNIRWQKGEEEHMPQPIGIGFKAGVGWFCLMCGQGPFVAWLENEE